MQLRAIPFPLQLTRPPAVANMCCEDGLRAIMAEQVNILITCACVAVTSPLQFHAFNCMFPLLEHRDIEVRSLSRFVAAFHSLSGRAQYKSGYR